MALNITTLATRWGKLFGGINVVNTFSGTTIPARADTISALYTTAAAQRIVTSTLYDSVNDMKGSLANGIVSQFQFMVNATLQQMCDDDLPSNLAPNPGTTDYLNKLVIDMLAGTQTFQKPTVTINASATFASGTAITTLLGTPYGNGIIVGTIIDPSTGNPRLYVRQETVRLVCTQDSYQDGVTPGTEQFDAYGAYALSTADPLWPGGSGASTTVQGAPSVYGSLFSNAYFLSWTDPLDVNKPDNWTLANLTTGTSITRSSDSYTGITGEYSCRLTAAILNAELYQQVTGLVGNTNYIAAIRVKRVTAITGGVLTVGLRDGSGTYLKDALNNDLKFTVALTGASGAFLLTNSVFSLPRGFAATAYLSLKITTAMVAAETIGLATVELIPMTSLYTGGPDIALLPGSVSFARQDTNTFTVANSAGTTSFIMNLERTYGISQLGINIPVAASPSQADALIS